MGQGANFCEQGAAPFKNCLAGALIRAGRNQMGQAANFCGQGAAPFKNCLAGALSTVYQIYNENQGPVVQNY